MASLTPGLDDDERRTTPHIIHQMWLDKRTEDNSEPPSKYLNDPQGRFVDSYKKWNPTYEYRFWNMKAVKALFARPEFARWRLFWESKLTFHIERCDFARYAVMYAFGGVYADLDSTCVRSLDDDQGFLMNRAFTWVHDSLKTVFNGVMASCARHEIWLQLMDFIMFNYPESKSQVFVGNTTGPDAIGRFVRLMDLDEDRRPDLFVDACHVFCPLARLKTVRASDGRAVHKSKTPLSFDQAGTLEDSCQGKLSFIVVDQLEGSRWQLQPAVVRNFVSVRVWQPNAALFAIFLLLLVVILLALWMYDRRLDAQRTRLLQQEGDMQDSDWMQDMLLIET
jgi:hypothetical protein